MNHGQAAFLRFPHLITHLGGQPFPQRPGEIGQCKPHMTLAGQGAGQRGVFYHLLMAEFEVAHPQFVRQLDRPVDQTTAHFVVVRLNAIGVEVGQANEEATEQKAANVGQRQEAARFPPSTASNA